MQLTLPIRAIHLDAALQRDRNGDVPAATVTFAVFASSDAEPSGVTSGRASKTRKLALPASLLERGIRLLSFIVMIWAKRR